MKYKVLFLSVLAANIFLSPFFCFSQSDSFWETKISKKEALNDFDTAYQRILSKHINPFWKINAAAFEKEYNAIRARLKNSSEFNLTKEDLMIRVQELLSNTSDIHSNSFQVRGSSNCRLFPLYFKKFNTKTGYEFRIMIADSANNKLLGGEIVRINNYSISEIGRKLKKIFPKNFEESKYYLTRLALRNANLLHGLGIINSIRQTNITIQLASGEMITKEIPAYYSGELDKLKLEYYDDLLKEVPLTRQNRDLYFWYKNIPAENAVYFRYSAVANNDSEITVAFSQRLFSFIDSVKADKLVIDIRDNGGGNGFLNFPFIVDLQKSRVNKQGKLFCLTNGLTFSAAIIFLHQLDSKSAATIIGEAPADAPNFCSDLSQILCRELICHLHYQPSRL